VTGTGSPTSSDLEKRAAARCWTVTHRLSDNDFGVTRKDPTKAGKYRPGYEEVLRLVTTLWLAPSPGSQRARAGVKADMSWEPRTLSRRSLSAASLPGAAVKTMMRRSAPCTDSTSQSSSSAPASG